MAYPVEVDVTTYTNETFAFPQDISGWATALPLSLCKFRAQMRAAPNSPVLIEWSTDNGLLTYSEAPASVGYAFTVQPTAGQVLTIGSSTISFVASGASGLQVNIGGSLTATLASLLTLVQSSADSQVSLCTWSLSGTTLYAVAKQTGALGNLISATATVTGCTVTGATLTNGANVLSFLAPMSITGAIAPGVYTYDCRVEYLNVDDQILFGGTVTFLAGNTQTANDGLVTPIIAPAAAYVASQATLINALIFG